MPPRLAAAQGFSFIGFYSCYRVHLGQNTRAAYHSHCLHTKHRPSPPKRIADKRHLHATSPVGASKDPYKVLGVDRDATQAEIKKTYFTLARKYHPDTNPDKTARDKFVEIQEAYEILKDEKKRKAYDQFGSASQQQGFDPDAFASGGFSGGSHTTFDDLASAFGGFRSGGGGGGHNLFHELFGAFAGGGPRTTNARGADLETTIGISFVDACKGTTRKINVSPIVNCTTCSGSGLKSGTKRSTCTTCGGSGSRTFVIDSGFQMSSTCQACSGLGSTIPRNSQCGSCGGVGKVRQRKTVEVNIPAGVEDGMTIRVPNAGDAPVTSKGASGDLLVRVNISPSKQFVRQGSNLYHEAEIPMQTALLGGKVRVPTLDGDVEVRVPSGTQPGEEMLLKGRGVPKVFGAGTGDLFVTFSVRFPRSLTSRQRQLLQEFADDIEGKTSTASNPPPNSDFSTSKEPTGSDNQNERQKNQNDTETPPDGEKKRATA